MRTSQIPTAVAYLVVVAVILLPMPVALRLALAVGLCIYVAWLLWRTVKTRRNH